MKAEDEGATQIYHELHAVIRRYMNESPDTTAFQCIGALEAVKFDLIDNLKEHNQNKGDAEY